MANPTINNGEFNTTSEVKKFLHTVFTHFHPHLYRAVSLKDAPQYPPLPVIVSRAKACHLTTEKGCAAVVPYYRVQRGKGYYLQFVCGLRTIIGLCDWLLTRLDAMWREVVPLEMFGAFVSLLLLVMRNASFNEGTELPILTVARMMLEREDTEAVGALLTVTRDICAPLKGVTLTPIVFLTPMLTGQAVAHNRHAYRKPLFEFYELLQSKNYPVYGYTRVEARRPMRAPSHPFNNFVGLRPTPNGC